jgi:polar amino acid transport system substrate-binding protein
MTRLALAFAVAAVLAASAHAADRAVPTKQPGTLVVALSLGSSDLQAGAVRGREVVLAKGFEADLARALARRLGLRSVVFVQAPRRSLTAAGRKRWDLALAQLRPGGGSVDYSRPYLAAAHAVVARRGLPRPAGLAELRRLQLCAERGTSSAAAVAARVRPALAPQLGRSVATVVRRVQTGACDAALVEIGGLPDALSLGGRRVGPLVGRIDTGFSYAAAFERGSRLRPHVDRALRALRADGTLARLRAHWLGADPLRLPELR